MASSCRYERSNIIMSLWLAVAGMSVVIDYVSVASSCSYERSNMIMSLWLAVAGTSVVI